MTTDSDAGLHGRAIPGRTILQEDATLAGRASRWGRAGLRLARQKPLGTFGLALLLIIIVLALLAPAIAPFDPQENHAFDRLQAPSGTYILGTDKFGRDQLSRILYGARTSLYIATMSTALGIGAGTMIGMLTGFSAGGRVDLLLQRLIDIQMSIPAIILAIAIITGIGRGTWTLIAVVAIVLIPTTARVMRGAVLAERSRPYVDAARVIGCTDARTMVRHIFPNIMGPLLVLMTAALGNTLLIEGSLSFLGYGPPPPTPTLGGMLSGENRDVIKSAVWLSIFPGLVLAIAVYSFNVLGDALRDKLDPRLRGA